MSTGGIHAWFDTSSFPVWPWLKNGSNRRKNGSRAVRICDVGFQRFSELNMGSPPRSSWFAPALSRPLGYLYDVLSLKSSAVHKNMEMDLSIPLSVYERRRRV